MACDVPSAIKWDAGTIPVFVSVRGNDEDELKAYWAKRSDGAVVVQSLESPAWSPLYGMLKDRFGVTWVLDIERRERAPSVVMMAPWAGITKCGVTTLKCASTHVPLFLTGSDPPISLRQLPFARSLPQAVSIAHSQAAARNRFFASPTPP